MDQIFWQMHRGLSVFGAFYGSHFRRLESCGKIAKNIISMALRLPFEEGTTSV